MYICVGITCVGIRLNINLEKGEKSSHTDQARKEMEELCGERRRRVVLVPYFLQGHMTPMLQLGSMLHSKGFSIVVALQELNSPNPSNYPDFTFLHMPDKLAGVDTLLEDSGSLIYATNKNCEAPFHDHMVGLMEEEARHGEVACIIYDSIMMFVDKIGSHFKVPTLVLRPHSAAYVLANFHMFRLVQEKVIPLPESKMQDVIPKGDPLRFKDLPLPATMLGVPEGVIDLLRSYMDIRSSSGVIWNNVDTLDHEPMQILQQLYWKVPFFSVGPSHKMAPDMLSTSIKEEDNSCLSWLDKQAPNSVVFVSFGSLAIVDDKELNELAWGLVKSEQPFLWAVGKSLPSGSDASNWLSEDLRDVIRERGCIVKWAPQKKVLAHPSVGGFLTHCGWNSTLESMCEGVPMICRPFYADQLVDARYVTYVWKIGIELEHGDIEKAVRKLMVSEEGKEMRQRALGMKQQLENSIKPGGSSYESINELVGFINSLEHKP